MQGLSSGDMYALARAAAGLPWQHVPTTPTVNLLLHHLRPADSAQWLPLLGLDVSAQILQIDPHGPPPVLLPDPVPEPEPVPALPTAACLSERALVAAEQVGGWLDDAMRWARARSPMTPPIFLSAGLVWALGLAVARRVAAPLHKPVYPHLYVLWVAMTSIHRKTTGMAALYDLVSAALPHLLLAEESTPEAFVGALSGLRPRNYDNLSAYEKGLEDRGRLFAAQRGMLIDEASTLLGASRRDYMQGHAEMILRLHDAPSRYTRLLRSEGKMVIYDASLCILGATTPASLARTITDRSWETGELARFVLLYPQETLPYQSVYSLEDYAPPMDLVCRLRALHEALPSPPGALESRTQQRPAFPVMAAHLSSEALAAYDAYAQAVTYDLLRRPEGVSARLKAPVPDARLHPNYARLHIQAMKVAVALAASDWVDRGASGPLCLELGHWARAQQMAEQWRVAAHQLLAALGRNEDSQAEGVILNMLRDGAAPMTLRELSQRSRLRRRDIEGALRVLVEAGQVGAERRRRGPRGPEAQLYFAQPAAV